MARGDEGGRSGSVPWRPLLLAAILVVAGVLAWTFLPPLLAAPPTYAVRVTFPSEQCWTGGITVDGDETSHEGCGAKVLEVEACTDAMVAIFQKGVDGGTGERYPGTLAVAILRDGEVVEEQSTSTALYTVAVDFTCSGRDVVM